MKPISDMSFEEVQEAYYETTRNLTVEQLTVVTKRPLLPDDIAVISHSLVMQRARELFEKITELQDAKAESKRVDTLIQLMD